MHHICEVLDWPSVHDLYPFVGMRAERRTKRKSPAKPRTVKSLAAPAKAAQGTCTIVHRFDQRVTGQCISADVRLEYIVDSFGMCLDAPHRIPRGSVTGYHTPSGYQAESVVFRGGTW